MRKSGKITVFFLTALSMSILACAVIFAAERTKASIILTNLIARRDAAIADSFDIDLSGYRILNPPEKEYFEKNLLETRKQVNVRGGDTVPITYINPEGSIVYVIKQEAFGMNEMYKFKKSNDDWILISSDQVQGIKMKPSNQAESLRLRNTAEIEEMAH